jgi:threonyl-tRNA synthetase
MNGVDLERMRHSCAHVLAAAVVKLHPQAKLGVGPAIADGFYYDIHTPTPLTTEDLPPSRPKCAASASASCPSCARKRRSTKPSPI